jgi:hypothetical protein
MMYDNKSIFCLCCGYDTMSEDWIGNYEICHICFWEDDRVQRGDPDYAGGANRVSLNQARINFNEFGACDREFLRHGRKPNETDVRNLDFQ